MNAKKIHSPMAKASCTASTAAAVPSSTRSPPPDSAYLDAPDRDELVIKMPASADDAQMDRIKVYCDAMLSMHGIPIEDVSFQLICVDKITAFKKSGPYLDAKNGVTVRRPN